MGAGSSARNESAHKGEKDKEKKEKDKEDRDEGEWIVFMSWQQHVFQRSRELPFQKLLKCLMETVHCADEYSVQSPFQGRAP